MAHGATTGFQKLVETERRMINERRSKLGLASASPPVGLALSGGGIRSATFCLGFLQALSGRRLLPRIDYLSTVSGGSYVGSFFGALFVPPEGRGEGGGAPQPPFDSADPLGSPLGVEAVRRLRDSGRYLTPAGTSDAFFGAAVVMRNWVAVQLVIGLTALLGFWLLRSVDHLLLQRWLGPPAAISPTLAGLAGLALALQLASALAYWFTRREWIPSSRFARSFGNLFFWLFLLVVLYSSAPWWAPDPIRGFAPDPSRPFVVVALICGLAIAFFLLAEFVHGAVSVRPSDSALNAAQVAEQRRRDLNNPQLLLAAEDRVRAVLSRWMATCLTWFLIFAGLILIDFVAWHVPGAVQRLWTAIAEGRLLGALANAWPALVTAGPPIMSFLAHQQLKKKEHDAAVRAEGKQAGSWVPAFLVIAGAALVAMWLLLWSAVSHFAFWPEVLSRASQLTLLLIAAAACLVMSLCFSFINLSSLSTFYAARLRRAYIGASSHGRAFASVREDDPQDTIRIENYYRYGIPRGAPLHLINVTIAETTTGSSNLVARDRKGKPMHLSPLGVVYEGPRPGISVVQGRRWGEELPLANWVAVSGAAVSAAIGSGTSLGTSILATMANLRLGYWWKQERGRRPTRLLWSGLHDTVQNYLFLELRGAFHGTRRSRWYLDKAIFEARETRALAEGRDAAAAEPMPHWTIHDLRTTFNTHSCEILDVPPHVADRILNHVATATRSKVMRVYNKSELFEPRRQALNAWAGLLEQRVLRGPPGSGRLVA